MPVDLDLCRRMMVVDADVVAGRRWPMVACRPPLNGLLETLFNGV